LQKRYHRFRVFHVVPENSLDYSVQRKTLRLLEPDKYDAIEYTKDYLSLKLREKVEFNHVDINCDKIYNEVGKLQNRDFYTVELREEWSDTIECRRLCTY
jgi:Cu2+-containing amine oxidase